MIHLTKRAIKGLLSAGSWERLRGRWWRYLRPLTVDYCPVMLPWFSNRRADGPSRLHQLAMSFHWGRRWSAVTAAALGVAIVRWPLRFALDSGRVFARHAPAIRARYGIPARTQLKGILRHGLVDNIPALYYYRFRLFDPGNARRARYYLHPEEMSILHPTLAMGLPPDSPLRDKELFFTNGVALGLPVVPAVAFFGDGGVRHWHASPPHVLPCCDLVLKPVDDGGGNGVQLWRYLADSHCWSRGATRLDQERFLDYCARQATLHRHVLQVRLHNHPDLRPLSANGLSTLRIVTYRSVEGASGAIVTCLRMPTGAAVIDNFDAGGITAPIDPVTGVLGPAVAKDPREGAFPAHPDSGARIAGAVVPHFQAALALTLEAHSAFSWVPFVGWDVVITPDGPLLLEANPDFGVEHAQISMNTPLGQSTYTEVYLGYLSAKEPASGSPVVTPAQAPSGSSS
jgi:hypothetical protein